MTTNLRVSKWLHNLNNHPVGRFFIPVVVILTSALIPTMIQNNYWIRVLDSALIYTMMALGLNIMLGYTGLLNLGYAAYFAIGAYMWGILGSPQYDLHWNFWLVFFMAGLAAGIVAYLLAIPGLGLKGDYLALVTIGFG